MSEAVTRLLDSRTVAELLTVSLRTLESWRLNAAPCEDSVSNPHIEMAEHLNTLGPVEPACVPWGSRSGVPKPPGRRPRSVAGADTPSASNSQRTIEPDDPARDVPNPKRRANLAELREARASLARLQAD